MRGIAVIVKVNNQNIVGAGVTLGLQAGTTQNDGAWVVGYSGPLVTAITVTAKGYKPFQRAITLNDQPNQNICVGFQGADSDISLLPGLQSDVKEAAHIRVEGMHFIDQTGNIWMQKGINRFGVVKEILDGREITSMLRYRRDLGFNTICGIGMKDFGRGGYFELDPRTYGDAYYQALPAVADILNSNGFRLYFYALADCNEIPLNQQEHVDRCADALKDKENVTFVFGNESGVNGWDASALRVPNFPGPFSPGSRYGGDDTPVIANTFRPANSFSVVHQARNGNWLHSFTKITMDVIQGYPGYEGTQGMLMHEEDMKCAEDVRDNTRNNPVSFYHLGALMANFGKNDSYGPGGNFFCQDEFTMPQTLQPNQERCAIAFCTGVDAVQNRLV